MVDIVTCAQKEGMKPSIIKIQVILKAKRSI